jgi:signal transduction histidine kinase/DNA-binding NarL/FixJ family response regulator
MRAVSSWLASAGVFVAAGCFCALVQGPLWRQASALAALNLTVSLLFVLTGLLLRNEPGQRGVAWALMLAGVFRSVDFIDAWNGSWPVYALVFGGVDRLFGAWALLRYPNPSLLKFQRIYLVLLAGWMLVGRTLIAVTSTARWNGTSPSSWWPTVLPDLQLNDAINYVVNAGEGLFGVALIILLVMRLTQTKGLDRIVIAPIIVAGIAAVVAASVSALAQMLVSLDTSPNSAYIVESAVDLAVPLAFLIAVIQRALLIRNITGLTAQVAAGADVSSVRYALRSTLHDPTLDVLDLSAPDPALEDAQPPDRLVEFIRAETGTPIAVVIADPALARYRGLFDSAVQTSGLALKNAQLQAQAAREKLEQVRASRARIIEAGLAERRRLERDLHDGVQQHLLGLAARLAAATARTTDPEATAAFGQAREDLRKVLAELRDLAHGIHPAALSHSGLAAALEEVAERLPLPVRVTAPSNRAGAAVEATAYFVACEALTNVVKHARASNAAVTIRVDEAQLEMEIADDGVGGAGPGGHGLANLRDRVSALDGEVVIDSQPGQGTSVIVRLPMRLAIAEDSGLFRTSLALLLEAYGAQVTASASSGPELIAAIRPDPPDVVILDIRMPPSFTDEGIRTAAELRGRYPPLGILVLSTYAETGYASQLLEAVSTGVGYLLKDNVTDAGALMDSLARVAAGQTVLDPTIVRRLLHRNRTPSKIDMLNERERTVLRHMAEGRSNVGIARELYLSPRTVETHVTSVFTKLGLDQSDNENNRVRAVLAFLRSADSGS